VITYAVMGRDEGRTLEIALGQALEAAEDGDRVWFVDSASSDGSADIARRLGVEVLPAPAGKGRAVAVAVEHCGGGPLCLLDADIDESSCNIAAALADAWRATGADMVIGTFFWPDRPLNITRSIHGPLVRALFPEYVDLLAPQPLSGFRVLDTSFPLGRLPAGYGLECHLNVHVAATGGRIAWVDLGTYRGPLRFRATMAPEIGEAILDVAEAQGRITPSQRAEWDAWLQPVLQVLAAPQPADDAAREDYRRRLLAACDRPFPVATSAAKGA
jgi:glucosyl-3-phosphoglycerate synthase